MIFGTPGEPNNGQHDVLPEAHTDIKVAFFTAISPEVRPIISNILGRRFVEDQFVGAGNFLDRLFLDLWATDEQRAERLRWQADEQHHHGDSR